MLNIEYFNAAYKNKYMEADRIMKEVHRIAYNVMSLNIDYCKNNIVHEIQLHKLQLQTLRITIIFNKQTYV